MSAPQFQFSSVTFTEADAWSAFTDCASAAAGTVFLLGTWGASSGLLKLTRQGQFLLLTCAQLFQCAPFRWPVTGDLFVLRDSQLLRNSE